MKCISAKKEKCIYKKKTAWMYYFCSEFFGSLVRIVTDGLIPVSHSLTKKSKCKGVIENFPGYCLSVVYCFLKN